MKRYVQYRLRREQLEHVFGAGWYIRRPLANAAGTEAGRFEADPNKCVIIRYYKQPQFLKVVVTFQRFNIAGNQLG